jgi:hypothetical protein
MYENLGIHWASSIPAFLALACVPFPFLFCKYGPAIRMRCKYAAEAARVLEQIRKGSSPHTDEEEEIQEETQLDPKGPVETTPATATEKTETTV